MKYCFLIVNHLIFLFLKYIEYEDGNGNQYNKKIEEQEESRP